MASLAVGLRMVCAITSFYFSLLFPSLTGHLDRLAEIQSDVILVIVWCQRVDCQLLLYFWITW